MASEKGRLSESNLWKIQKRFYQDEGVEAWNCKIPFYITCNPYIANAYAAVIMKFMEEYGRIHPESFASPFYILEMGSGPGRFGFYLLKRLRELMGASSFAGRFVYVMSDIVEKNIRFWEENPQFKDFIEAGILDFALLDDETDHPVQLRISGIELDSIQEEKHGNPLILIANYVLDSLPQDIFRVKDGTLQEGLFNQDIILPGGFSNFEWIHLGELDHEIHYRDLRLPYYGYGSLDRILEGYSKSYQNTYVIFPTGAFQYLKKFRTKISPKVFFLSADKGFTQLLESKDPYILGLGVHTGCVSAMVNYDALSQYAAYEQGDSFHMPSESINQSAMGIGFKLREMPETWFSISQWLGTFNPGFLNEVYSHFAATQSYLRTETILTLLELTQWDPVVFDTFFNSILNQLPDTLVHTLQRLGENIHKIAENFYYQPGTTDTLANIGVFLQSIQDYKEAIPFYQASVHYFGETGYSLYNQGICYYFMKEYEKALQRFRSNLQLFPDSIHARGWISRIESELQDDAAVL